MILLDRHGDAVFELSLDTVTALREQIFKALDFAKSERQSIEAEWEEFYKLYRIEKDERKIIFETQFTPFCKLSSTSIAVRRLLRSIVRALLPYARPFDINLVGSGQQEGEGLAEDTTHSLQTVKKRMNLIDYQLFERNRFRDKAKQIVLQYLLYGVSPVRTYWFTPREKAYTLEGNKTVQRYLPSDGYPVVEPVNVARFYVYPHNIETLDTARYIFEFGVQTKDYLRALAKEGHVSDEQLEHAFDQPSQGTDVQGYGLPGSSETVAVGFEFFSVSKEPMLRKLGIREADFNKEGAYAVTLDVWMRSDVDGDGVDEWVNIFYVNGTPVRSWLSKLPWQHPYLVARANELPGEFYQHSIVRIGARLQYVAENILSVLLNHLKVHGLNTLRISRLSGEDVQLGVDKPVKMDPDGVEPLVFPDRVRSLLAVLGQIENWGRSAIDGFVGQAVGTAQRGARTKGGLALMAEDAQSGVVELASSLETQLFEPIIKRLDQMNLYYLQGLQEDYTFPTRNGKEDTVPDRFTEQETISPTELLERPKVEHRWMGSMRLLSESAVADGLFTFAGIASKADPQKVEIDQVALLQKIYGILVSQAEAERIVKPAKKSLDNSAQSILNMGGESAGGGPLGQEGLPGGIPSGQTGPPQTGQGGGGTPENLRYRPGKGGMKSMTTPEPGSIGAGI